MKIISTICQMSMSPLRSSSMSRRGYQWQWQCQSPHPHRQLTNIIRLTKHHMQPLLTKVLSSQTTAHPWSSNKTQFWTRPWNTFPATKRRLIWMWVVFFSYWIIFEFDLKPASAYGRESAGKVQWPASIESDTQLAEYNTGRRTE